MKKILNLAFAFFIVSLAFLAKAADRKKLTDFPFEPHSVHCSFASNNDVFSSVQYEGGDSESYFYKLSADFENILYS